MPKVEALYTLWPRQQEAMRLLGLTPNWQTVREPVEELLYGGEAGGGKSLLLRCVGVTLCTLWPGAVVPLFRRTYPELEETHIRAIQREVPESVATYHRERHELRFPNGSVLEFRYCERDGDVYRYQSAEWDALLLDEATQFTQHQVEYLRTRVRSTRPDWRRVFVYGTNPGNLGHSYFKRAFVDPAPAGQPFTAPATEGGFRRCFLRARLDDNPSLPTDYRQQLEGLKDEALRRALLEGDWDVFAGQFFSEWRRDVHVCRPFAVPPEWPRWMGLDYGYAAPMCGLWLARSNVKAPDGRLRIYVYRELYGPGLRDVEQALRIRGLSVGEQINARYADPSMWSRQPNGTTLAQVYESERVHLVPANNDRLAGWQRVHAALAHSAEQPPVLQVFDTCTNLVRTLPDLVHDATHVEDVDTDGEDHGGDSLRYALMGAARPQAQTVDARFGGR